jgi:ABC-type sugar transport system substrate-binding protein
MADVFISYKGEDRTRVEPLVETLKSKGFNVWWDLNLLPGEKIGSAIQEILNKVSCVIVVWSKRSLKSNWVPDEATFGRDHNMLIPVTIDGSKPPLGFQQLLTLDLQAWSGDAGDPLLQKLFLAVRKLLRQPKRQRLRSTMADEVQGQTRAMNMEVIRDRFMAIRNRRVFLIVGSFNEEWQISLNYQLMRASQRFGLSCSVLVPSEDYSVAEQTTLLQSALADGNDYFGGILVCSGWSDPLVKNLLAIMRHLPLPVILVDRNPPAGLSRIPPKLSYVSVSDAEGGKLAADAVLQLVQHSRVKRILVIAGFAKHGRHKSFQKKISKTLPHCEMDVRKEGQFDRWVSENVAYNRLTEAIKDKKPFDVVFCTADSMTLGCLDAIERVTWDAFAKPKVVGYDGTVTTKKLIDNSRSPLIRIVIQDNAEIADAAVSQLIQSNQKAKDERLKKIIWVKPYLYPHLEEG